MNPDFFIKLTLGAYRVTDFLPPAEQKKAEIRNLANSVLANLIFFSLGTESSGRMSDTTLVTQEQRKSLVPKTLGDIDSLVRHFVGLKSSGKVEIKYLLILEKEYQKIARWVEDGGIAPDTKVEPVRSLASNRGENSLSERQRKIIGILQNKEKTQVWELQKVLTEVTKRTLRRDLDDLLSLNLIERKGEWNEVFYRMKQ